MIFYEERTLDSCLCILPTAGIIIFYIDHGLESG